MMIVVNLQAKLTPPPSTKTKNVFIALGNDSDSD